MGPVLLAFGASLAVASMAGCWVRVAGGSKEANELVKALHGQMAAGDLAGIYSGADERYRKSITRDKSDALFGSIARKLGAPQDCVPKSTMTQMATFGTTITLVCQTTFAKNATGIENISWVRTGGQYRLMGYYINSDELIQR